jgi:hypothetical protein
MKAAIRFVLLTFIAVLPAMRGASADELEDRRTIADETVTLLKSEDFAKLEELADIYRRTQSRTSSGLWKLTLFYSGLSMGCHDEKPDSPAWVTIEQRMGKWVQQYPDSPTSHLAYAKMLINHAWSYRGCGYADEVKEENWKPFYDYVGQARSYLEAHKAVAAKDPRWYELMADVALAQGWSDRQFSGMIEEGLEKSPGFYELYFSAIDFYTPKWGSSSRKIEKFARQSVERAREAEGEGLYARIYWYASQTQYDERLFWESRVDWPEMKKGIDDVLAHYPDQWNINNFARFACMAQDQAKTKELMDRIEGEPLWEAWRRVDNFDQCKAFAVGATPQLE